MSRILILCTGNSCRSQMAHGFLQSLDKTLEVCSAGTQPAAHVNAMAVSMMQEIGIDISTHTPTSVERYLDQCWDYVITVCDHANETCPIFQGKVGKRMHIGFEDPSKVTGSPDFIYNEFVRVREEIKREFTKFYFTEINSSDLPKCICSNG
ncbi:arsenate reductase ArsC [Prevotella sp. S7 MS 2]|uniref:arsenate reductase ArsC n=1 Tax=Prevotella sp. S7 MS 2 TaxID=1287488 RepID=UPI0005667600|nr:arsenate reductase ArsC [Prevotella sp. S7 MS 2]